MFTSTDWFTISRTSYISHITKCKFRKAQNIKLQYPRSFRLSITLDVFCPNVLKYCKTTFYRWKYDFTAQQVINTIHDILWKYHNKFILHSIKHNTQSCMQVILVHFLNFILFSIFIISISYEGNHRLFVLIFTRGTIAYWYPTRGTIVFSYWYPTQGKP